MFRKTGQQSGNAALIAILFITFAILSFFTIYSLRNSKIFRNIEKNIVSIDEKWQSRSQANILSQVVKYETDNLLAQDIQFAKDRCSAPQNLKLFDEESLEVVVNSVVKFDSLNHMSCNNQIEGNFTSFFGKFSDWGIPAKNRLEEKGISLFQIDTNITQIIEFQEIYRRSFDENESNLSYGIRYLVEAKIGQFRTRVNGELILGANLPNCGTTAILEVNPSSVTIGNPVNFNVTYSYAQSIKIYNSTNTLIHSTSVPEVSTPQNYNFVFTPSVTDTYKAVVSGSGGCSATTSQIRVEVVNNQNSCSTNPPNILFFESSSLEVIRGEEVNLRWNTSGGISKVRLNNVDVAANENSHRVIINSDTEFVLRVEDSDNMTDCPQERRIQIRVRNNSNCNFVSPQIQNFSAFPSSVEPGNSTVLSWNVTGLESTRSLRIEGVNGFVTNLTDSFGSISVTPPSQDGDYNYTLYAENICVNGTRLTSQFTVTIRVRTCPPPEIQNFSLSPTSVIAGQGMVRFNWMIEGFADSVSISNGIGSGLPLNSYLEIPSPTVPGNYSYTLSARGCGQTKSSSVTLLVSALTNFQNMSLLSYSTQAIETTEDISNNACRSDQYLIGNSYIPMYRNNNDGTITVKNSYPVGRSFIYNRTLFYYYLYSWSIVNVNSSETIATGTIPFPDNSSEHLTIFNLQGYDLNNLRLNLHLVYDDHGSCYGEQYSYQASFSFY